MGTAELLLALDAGSTRLQAVLVSAGAGDEAITDLGLGGDRGQLSAVAFISEDGEVRFGDDAESRGAAHPERVVRDVMSHVGDPVPLVVGGFIVPAEQLVARMVRWAVSAVVIQHGHRPACIALTHPTGWRAHRVEALSAALQEAEVGDVLLVPAAIAAARHAAHQGRSRIVSVYDLGGDSFEASVINGQAVAGPPCTLAFGAAELDLSLLRHVLGFAAGGRAAPSAAELAAARRGACAAKESLSQRSDVEIDVSLDGRQTRVRVTRAELEDLAQPLVDRTVDALEHALDEAHVAVGSVDEIVLVGGGAHLPLVAQTLSSRTDRPLTVPDHPQFATALGAALIAWERTADRRRLRTPEPQTEQAQPERTSSFAALIAALRGTRVPYGAATAVVAAGVIIGAGMVFGASTPMGESTTASAQDAVAGDGDVRIARAASGFEAAGQETGEDADEARAHADVDDTGSPALPRSPHGAPGSDFDPRSAIGDGTPSRAASTPPPSSRIGASGTGTPQTGAPGPAAGAGTSAPVADPVDGIPTSPDPTPDPGPTAPAPTDPTPEPAQDPAPTEPAPAEPAPSGEPGPSSDTTGSTPEPATEPSPTSGGLADVTA